MTHDALGDLRQSVETSMTHDALGGDLRQSVETSMTHDAGDLRQSVETWMITLLQSEPLSDRVVLNDILDTFLDQSQSLPLCLFSHDGRAELAAKSLICRQNLLLTE